MIWIICQQTQHNEIKYMTENEKINYLGYNDFLVNLTKYPLFDRQNFKLELDKFQIIYIDLQTGKWEIKKPDLEKSNASFDDLYKLNGKKQEEEKKSKSDLLIEKGHNFINNWKGSFKFYED